MAPRVLALLPASFVTLAAIMNARMGTLHDLVWVCNAMNVALAISLAAGSARGIWISTMWLCVGTPLWIVDAWTNHDFMFHSFLTHFAATGVGLYALRFTPRPRHIWWQAALAGIGLQLLSRALTAPEHNINVAWGLYTPLREVLPALAANFPLAEALNIAAFCVTMIALTIVLGRVPRSY